jgi:hypothetical protein
MATGPGTTRYTQRQQRDRKAMNLIDYIYTSILLVLWVPNLTY